MTSFHSNVIRPIDRRRLVAGGAAALLGVAVSLASARAGQATQRADARDIATVVLAGLDTRTPEGPQNTDVLLIARVDLEAGTVRALSIPRDLYVIIPGVGRDKITTAYDYGINADPDRDWKSGFASTIATVERNFGLEIDGGAVTDFAGLPALVEAVGGITVDNPYTIYEPDSEAVIFPEGQIELDGESALEFTRVRHQDGDDGRVMRQQLVLTALVDAARESDLLEDVPALLDLVGDAVRIELPLPLQLRFARAAPDLTAEDVAFGTMTDRLSEGETDDGQWIYEADWDTLPEYVQQWLDGDIE
ncbi:MAG TPA: LCP family protein [Thermomicrobiales bacterium]|nr:LCP family protein [Thermomicrobiales bacterium]